MNGIEPAKKMLFTAVTPSDSFFARDGTRLKRLAVANKRDPTAKIVPIHQFICLGIQRLRSVWLTKLVGDATVEMASRFRKLRESQVAVPPSRRR